MGKKKTVIASILVIVSLILNMVQYVQIQRLKNPKDEAVVGTFLAGNEFDAENSSYIVFQQDGGYVLYRQLEVLEKGSYSNEGQGFYSLAPAGNGQGGRVVYNGSDEAVLVDGRGGMELFVRISEIPTFINVNI